MFNIKRNLNLDVTAVSNKFILKLMPQANGDYVKIYLYFLSVSSSNNTNMDLDEIAQLFGYTPEFIIDALLYWENVGVIEGAYNGRGELVSMTFLDVPEIDELDINQENSLNSLAQDEDEKLKREEEIVEAEEELGITELGQSQTIVVPLKRVEELCDKDDVRMIMIAAEQYLGHTLSHTEIELFLYLYDTCGFSADLLDYLVEYCVSKGSKSVHYMREVAFAWYEAGIDSVTKAKATTTTYHRDYSRIRSALGIKRDFGDIELEYLNKWINEYPIDTDMVVEACNRTLLNTGKPEFRYTDSILKDWIAKGYTNVDDIAKQDETPQIKTPILKANKTSSKFNNFESRTYDAETLSNMIKAKQAKQLSMVDAAKKPNSDNLIEVEEDLVIQA